MSCRSETRSAAAFTNYAYNDRNELTRAVRNLGTDPLNPDPEDAVDEERFSYAYDAIGNRSCSQHPEHRDADIGVTAVQEKGCTSDPPLSGAKA